MCSPTLDHFQLVNVLAQVGSQEKCRIDVAVSPDTILGTKARHWYDLATFLFK